MKKSITLFFLVLLIISAAGINASAWPWSAKPVKAEIVFVLGDVKVNGKKAETGTIINFNDIIETGNGSIVRILAAEKTVVQLKANSKMHYRLNDKKGELYLEKGWIAGVTRKVFTKDGKYSVRTPTAVAAIRGTSYCFKVENDLSSYFCICNGTINMTAAGENKGEDISSAHHFGERFIMADGKVSIEEAGMLYHTDEDLEELAAVINEKIDWSKLD
ncbi:MAG: FecR domain-containing protein [Spirochaetes bacterium]|nr:FecR domain-containing protein [Spirochaetota bacterium]